MKLNYVEVRQIHEVVERLISLHKKDKNFDALTSCLWLNRAALAPHYFKLNQEYEKLVEKYMVIENGIVKMQSKIVTIGQENTAPEKPMYKNDGDEEKFATENNDLALQEVDVELEKFARMKFIDGGLPYGDDSFIVLKYLTL